MLKTVNKSKSILTISISAFIIFLALLGSTWQKGLADDTIPTVPVVDDDYEPKIICVNSEDTQITVFGDDFINFDGIYYTSISWQGPTDTFPIEIDVDEINLEGTMLRFTLTADMLTEVGIGTFQVINHPDFGDPREVGDPKTILISSCKIFLPIVMKNAKFVYPLINGDFEAGPDGSWTEESKLGYDLIVDENYPDLPKPPHNGSWEAWLGGAPTEESRLSQLVTISPSSTYLHFWYWFISASSDKENDYFRLKVNGTQTYNLHLYKDINTVGWVEQVVDLSSYSGSTVSLMFEVTMDASSFTHFLLDDVSFSNVSTANPLDDGQIQIFKDVAEVRTISR